jgi:hypothetical protein
MIVPFKIGVEYGEICVFPTGYSAPCHDWTTDYLAQGFCWHESQTAFLTLQYDGVAEVTVQIENEVEVRPDAIRAIQVPIFVNEDSSLGLWPCTDMWFSIPEGEYCLVYQTGIKPFVSESDKKLGDFTAAWNDMWCVFTFVRADNVEAKILRRDEILNPPSPLFTTEYSPKSIINFPPDGKYFLSD